MTVTIDGVIHDQFDNFYTCKFIFEHFEWTSSEQAYQAYKFKETDYRYFLKIQRESDVKECYIMGQSRSHKIKEDFDSVKEEIMSRCIAAKFRCNTHMIYDLVRTKGEIFYDCGIPYWNKVNSSVLTMLRARFREEGYF